MKLGAKQEVFAENLARLILWAYGQGYRIRIGEVWRSDAAAAAYAASGQGIAKSVHRLKLAADINLFKDGKFLTDSASHRPLGEHWKTLHVDNRWGGDFKKRDGNHYSMTHGGIA
jgi:hypothetical protein